MNTSKPVADSLLREKAITCVAFLIALGLAALYVHNVGIAAVWPDTLFLADRTRHLLEEGRMATTAYYAASFPPLYSLLMIPAFAGPDILTGHWVLIALQTLLLASVFFPIRAMLLRGTELSRISANLLAILFSLLSTALPYASLLVPESLLIAIVTWFAYFYDGWLAEKCAGRAFASGILLGLAVLVSNIGWAVFIAATINEFVGLLDKKSARKEAGLIILLPLMLAGAWHGYAAIVLGQGATFPEWDMNNPLARFNFIKNALLYVCYAGMPVAGIVFLIAGVTKRGDAWGNPFFRFSLLCILLVTIYMALSTPVIVEKKLDYITNRLLEPFLLLPFIAFMRLAPDTRKECAANSLLIFFCFMIFGLPYGLKTDFGTGISYWSQSLGNANLGIIRNAIYLVLISLPIALLWWKPRFFIWCYLVVAALINLGNIAQDQRDWSLNEDANFNFVTIKAFENNDVMKQADAIYANYHCNTKENNDIAYLFRCFDLGRVLYFFPKQPKPISVQELRALKLEGEHYVLYASSEDDSLFGPTVGRMGLARIMKLNKETLQLVQDAPIVAVRKIEGLKRYVNLPVQSGLERVTLLDEKTTMHTFSDKAGCAELHLTLAGDEEEKVLELSLNGAVLKKTPVKRILAGSVPDDLQLPLQLKEGENTLSLKYGNTVQEPYTTPPNPSLFMFGRPMFKPCNIMQKGKQ